MSGQWEVVGKKKGKDNKLLNKQSVKETKKANVTHAPKIEDVLPPLQVKNLYGSGKTNKENNAKPVEKPKQENKKPVKKSEKPQEQPKVKPKSVENALNSINVEELKNLFENNKRIFPDSPLVWLKELTQFLNQRINVDIQDQIFSTKPENYPLSVVPHSIKNIIEKAIKDAGKSNAQTFYNICLTAMATDMGKGLPVLGHKLLLQYLAFSDPKYATASLSKHVTLRNSYQNQQSIGLSILWALGQCGNKDFHSGIKVFQEIMLPLVEMKNYSRYVINYLTVLINHHHSENISKEQYLLILDVVFANYKNFPSDLRPNLNKIVPVVKQMLLNDTKVENSNTLIEPLLRKLLSNNSNVYKKEICDILVNCLIKDPSSFNAWSKCYLKNVHPSSYLLVYLDENWKKLSSLINKDKLLDLLNSLSELNEELKTSRKKVEGLEQSITAIKHLKNKMATKRESRVSYNFLSFLLLLALGSILLYDIKLHGSWHGSRTYNGLKDVGVIEYSNKLIERGQVGVLWVHQRIDSQFPGYYEKVHKVLNPYAELFRDLGLVLLNILSNVRDIIVEKYPVVLESVEAYAPGLVEQSQKTVQSAWSTSMLYFNKSVIYLQQEVFVGKLAPENVQKVVIEAINTTQQKAAEYYYWVYEKVQSSIK